VNADIDLAWASWLSANREDLGVGAKVNVPSYLPHPQYAGFSKELVATPEGQVANWTLSVPADGSRIHVHEFADGRLVAHRDRYDPNHSLGNLVAHLLFETALVPVLLVVGFVFLAGQSARA
jgi:hypothetical protein